MYYVFMHSLSVHAEHLFTHTAVNANSRATPRGPASLQHPPTRLPRPTRSPPSTTHNQNHHVSAAGHTILYNELQDRSRLRVTLIEIDR